MMLWLNGALQDENAARIDPADRGFTLGDAVFETIRAVAGVPRFWPQHLARLEAAARDLGIPMPYAALALHEAIAALLAANAVPDAAIRITLTRGPAPRGLLPPPDVAPTLLITAAALPALPPPAATIIATSVTRDETSPLSMLKSVNYLGNILARREAAARGADDAILLNRHGNLAEATASNIFLLIGHDVITPQISDGALPGIARAALLAAFPIKQATLAVTDIGAARAGFLSNALGLRPLASIGATAFDISHPGLAPMLHWFNHP